MSASFNLYKIKILNISNLYCRCLDKNEYNHITATYYLLAERKLRANRQEHTNKTSRPENLAMQPTISSKKHNNGTNAAPFLLSVPRTPGDVPQVNF